MATHLSDIGEYLNFLIFDIDSNDELHALLSGLPLFAYMDIHVTRWRRTPPT